MIHVVDVLFLVWHSKPFFDPRTFGSCRWQCRGCQQETNTFQVGTFVVNTWQWPSSGAPMVFYHKLWVILKLEGHSAGWVWVHFRGEYVDAQLTYSQVDLDPFQHMQSTSGGWRRTWDVNSCLFFNLYCRFSIYTTILCDAKSRFPYMVSFPVVFFILWMWSCCGKLALNQWKVGANSNSKREQASLISAHTHLDRALLAVAMPYLTSKLTRQWLLLQRIPPSRAYPAVKLT